MQQAGQRGVLGGGVWWQGQAAGSRHDPHPRHTHMHVADSTCLAHRVGILGAIRAAISATSSAWTPRSIVDGVQRRLPAGAIRHPSDIL